MITALILKSANLLPSRGQSDRPEGSRIVYGENYEPGVENPCIMIHQCRARANCSAPNAGSDIALVRKHDESTLVAQRNVVMRLEQWVEVDIMIESKSGTCFPLERTCTTCNNCNNRS